MTDTGYSIGMVDDDKTANIQLRCEEPMTWRMLINRLRDLADQLEEEHSDEEFLWL